MKTKINTIEEKYFTTSQGYKLFYMIFRGTTKKSELKNTTNKSELTNKLKLSTKSKTNKKLFIVFQHGLTGNHTVWNGHMNYMFEQGYPFIIIDLLGHGNSQKVIGRKCYTIENQGDYVWQVLKHENIKNYIFVGQCLGALICLHNEIVGKTNSKAIVLIGTPLRKMVSVFIHPLAEPFRPILKILFVYFLGIFGMIFSRRKYPLIHYYNHHKAGRIKVFLLDMIGTPKVAYGWTIESMLNIKLIPYLNKIKKPVLLVYGEHDMDQLKDSYGQLTHNLNVKREVILTGVDHLVTLRAPIQLSKEIIKFINEIKYNT